MRKFTEEAILTYLIELLVYYLEELEETDRDNSNMFVYGEKTAYVECLEIIQTWRKAELRGLNFDIEKRFPIDR